MIDDRAPDEASLTWTLMMRTLLVVEGDPVSQSAITRRAWVWLSKRCRCTHSSLKFVSRVRSKAAVLMERTTGGHLVTDDELLEALDAFANYTKIRDRQEIETVVNIAFWIMNGDCRSVWQRSIAEMIYI